jgi:hypothetical protein
MERVDDPDLFNWRLNTTQIHAINIKKVGSRPSMALRIALTGYSPVFEHFMVRLDEEAWRAVSGTDADMYLSPGTHLVQARMVTTAGDLGPPSSVLLKLSDTP